MSQPAVAELMVLDPIWRGAREEGDPAAGWAWADIVRGCDESFAVKGVDGEIRSIWATNRRKPLKLDGCQFYRIDYLEVLPRFRRGGLGEFSLALVCWRAVELKADAVVLASVPDRDTLDFYREMGAEERCPKGWKHEPGLVPFVIPATIVTRFKEYADAFIQS